MRTRRRRVQQVLGLVTDAADALTIEAAQRLGAVVAILEQDLGVGPDFLQQEARIAEDVAHHLAQAQPESDRTATEPAPGRRAPPPPATPPGGGLLEFPLDPERMAERLFELIRTRTGDAQRVAAAGKAVTDAVGVGDLLGAVPFTGFGTGTVGAAAAAPKRQRSVLLVRELGARRGRPRPRPRRRIAFTTSDGTYTFKRYDPGALETWAYVTAVSGNALEPLPPRLDRGGRLRLEPGQLAQQHGCRHLQLAKRAGRRGVRVGGAADRLTSRPSKDPPRRASNCFKMWFFTLLSPTSSRCTSTSRRRTSRDGCSPLTLRSYDGPGSARPARQPAAQPHETGRTVDLSGSRSTSS